ncbi:hypothetical protein LGW06_08135, partial [Streptococcus mutans]|nr:hypothetical protein [Streptococcus mutans]
LKIGRIISADLGSCSISSFRFALSMINASLYPVRIPLLILIFQSFNGVPTDSILCFIDCSIGERIIQLSSLLKEICNVFCLI